MKYFLHEIVGFMGIMTLTSIWVILFITIPNKQIFQRIPNYVTTILLISLYSVTLGVYLTVKNEYLIALTFLIGYAAIIYVVYISMIEVIRYRNKLNKEGK